MSEKKGNGSGSHARKGAGHARGLEVKPVGARKRQYLIAPRSVPGLAPMATDMIATALDMMQDVEVVKRIKPTVFGTLAAGGGTPEIIVARMDERRGDELRTSSPPQVIVERDETLIHFQDFSLLRAAQETLVPAGQPTEIKFHVVGAGGEALANANVTVYGRGFPAQGITDESGNVSVTLFGGPAADVQAVYVKPVSNHWDKFLSRPEIDADGVNLIQLHPLGESFPEFPKKQMVGWGQKMMGLDKVDPTVTGRGVKIAIIDSGCDSGHPLLQHVKLGVDFTNDSDQGTWTKDTVMHGTHCAGIIGGGSSTLEGIRGFAPEAEIHVFKVFPGGRFNDLISALDQCIERQIDVANLSLGSDQVSEIVQQKLQQARQSGVACIVAAGNSGGPVQFPAILPSVLAVSAIGKMGEFPPDSFHARTVLEAAGDGSGVFPAKFSCFGPQIGVCGPGVAIVSTVPNKGYAAWDGTSMATPHVTGFAALLLAHHPLFQGPFKARSEQRVAQLFQLIGLSAVRCLADPARGGAGIPNLQRVPGTAGAGRRRDGAAAGQCRRRRHRRHWNRDGSAARQRHRRARRAGSVRGHWNPAGRVCRPVPTDSVAVLPGRVHPGADRGAAVDGDAGGRPDLGELS
jgi:subtilisin family serine protease